MRLPHYLVCSPSGTWHFRQRVPTDLHVVLGTKCFKHSLRTRDPLVAQRLALGIAERYARVIRQARGMHVSGEGDPSVATEPRPGPWPGQRHPSQLPRGPEQQHRG